MTTAHSWLWTWRIAIGCLALVTAWLPLRPAAALVPLTDGPEHFDVFFACPSALPGTCFGAETDARLVAGFLETAWDAYEGMGLPLPDLDTTVNLRNRRSDCNCTTGVGCSNGVPAMNLGLTIKFNMDHNLLCSNVRLANTAAHELAHSIQAQYILDYFPLALARGRGSELMNFVSVVTSTLEGQNLYEFWNWWEGWPSAMAMLVNTDDSLNPAFQGDPNAPDYLNRYLIWAQPQRAGGQVLDPNGFLLLDANQNPIPIPYPHEYVLPWRLQSEPITNSEVETIKLSGYYTGAFWMHLAQRIGTPPLSAATSILAGRIFTDMMETISTEIATAFPIADIGTKIGAGIDTFIDDELGMTRLEFLQDMSFAWAIERFGDPTPAGSLSPGLAVQRRSNGLGIDETDCNLNEQQNIDAPSWLVRHQDAAPPGPGGSPVEDQVGGEFVHRRDADDLLTGRTQFWSFDARTRAGEEHPLRPRASPPNESPEDLRNVPPFAVSVRTPMDIPAEWQARALGGHRCDDDSWITPVLPVGDTLQTIPNDLRFTDYAFLMNSRKNGRSPEETPAAPGGPSTEVYDQIWGGSSEGDGAIELRYEFAPEDAWLPLDGTLWSAPGTGRWTALSINAAEAEGPVAFIKGLSPELTGPKSDGKTSGLPDATAYPRSGSADRAKIEAVIVTEDEKARFTAEANSFEDALGSKEPRGNGIDAVGFGDIAPDTMPVTVMVTDDEVRVSDVGAPLTHILAVSSIFAEVIDPSDSDEERLPQPFDIVGRVERVDPGLNSRRREWDTFNPVAYDIEVDVDGRITTVDFDHYGLDTRMAVLGLPLYGHENFSQVTAHRVDILPVQDQDGRGGESYFVTGYAGDLIAQALPELIIQDTWLNFTELSCGPDGEGSTATAVVTAWVTNQGSEVAPRVCVDFDAPGLTGSTSAGMPVGTICAEDSSGNIPVPPGRTLGINATVEISFNVMGWVSGDVHAWTPGPEAIETNNLDAFWGSIACPLGGAPAATFKHDEIFGWADDQQAYRELLDQQNEIAELEAAIFMQEFLSWMMGPDLEPPVHRYFGPEYPRFHGLVRALEPLVAAGFTHGEIGQHIARLGMSPGELLGASTDQLRVLGDAAVDDAFFQSRVKAQDAQPKRPEAMSRLAMPGGVLVIGPSGEFDVYAPKETGYAVVDLRGFESGDVWFDGRFSGYDAREMPILIVPPGVHEVVVTNPGGVEEIASLCTTLEAGAKAALDPSMHCDLDANANQRQLRPQLELIEALEARVAKRVPDALAAAHATETEIDEIQEEFQLGEQGCAPLCAIGSFAVSRRLDAATQAARDFESNRVR